MDVSTYAYATMFVAVAVFTVTGYQVVRRMWLSYEERLLHGAAHELEQMQVNLPASVLLYLAVATYLLVAGFLFLVFQVVWVAASLAFPTLFMPRAIQVMTRNRRIHRFGLQLMDALDNMAQALKVGFSVQQAVDLVAREMAPPISIEFRVMRHEMQLGISIDKAMENLYQRMRSEDMLLITAVVGVSKDVGGNLAEIFDNISATIRGRIHIEEKIRSLTSQGKLQGLICAAMPLAVGYVLYLVNPELMEPMVRTPVGWGLISLILVMEVLGYIFIRKIVTIEV